MIKKLINQNSRHSRSLNRLEVFKVLQQKPITSRKELSEDVSFSRATVSGIVSEFITAGLIEETGEGKSTGGRPPTRLHFLPKSRFSVGIVLLDNEIRSTLTDVEGNPLRTLAIPLSETSPETMLNGIIDIFHRISKDILKNKIVSIGIGVPGIVNPASGEILVSISKGWVDKRIPVKEYLEKHLQMSVHVANRSRISALGENKAGVGRDVQNLIYLYIGQGITAGIVIDGKLYFGPGSCSGEIGHITIEEEGPLCECGNHGCLEVFATESAILAQARALVREKIAQKNQTLLDGEINNMTIAKLINNEFSEFFLAEEVFNPIGKAIGKSLAILINLFNPEMVIIGGPIGSLAKDLLLIPAQREAIKRTLPISLGSAKIVTGVLGTEATTIGAAVYGLNQTSIDQIIGLEI